VIYVLDACAIIAYLRDEPGAEIVENFLSLEPPSCRIHAINLCEVYYDFLRVSGESVASSAVDQLRAAGVFICEDMDEAFWQQAGRYKVSFRMSLADAFLASFAERFSAEVVTCDREEFEPVAKSGALKVNFIR
jgi:PIN domain nuclease of toxin-antitoxin system